MQNGGASQEIWQKHWRMIELESPCIHRIHLSRTDVPESYYTLGMTIELDTLNRMRILHSKI